MVAPGGPLPGDNFWRNLAAQVRWMRLPKSNVAFSVVFFGLGGRYCITAPY